MVVNFFFSFFFYLLLFLFIIIITISTGTFLSKFCKGAFIVPFVYIHVSVHLIVVLCCFYLYIVTPPCESSSHYGRHLPNGQMCLLLLCQICVKIAEQMLKGKFKRNDKFEKTVGSFIFLNALDTLSLIILDTRDFFGM